MLKIVPEVPVDAKSRWVRAVAQVAVWFKRNAWTASNDKNSTKAKHKLVIGFVI
jgi:hypothetical protein